MAHKRFRKDSIASSDGIHIHIKHDRRAGTTGRKPNRGYVICGTVKIRVTEMQFKMLAPCQRMKRL